MINELEAFEWFRKAADKNDNVALKNVARYYRFGIATDKDERKALEYYTKVCIPDDEEREQHQKIQDLHVRKPAVPLLLCPYLARTYVYALHYSHNRINCTVILIF